MNDISVHLALDFCVKILCCYFAFLDNILEKILNKGKRDISVHSTNQLALLLDYFHYLV